MYFLCIYSGMLNSYFFLSIRHVSGCFPHVIKLRKNFFFSGRRLQSERYKYLIYFLLTQPSPSGEGLTKWHWVFLFTSFQDFEPVLVGLRRWFLPTSSSKLDFVHAQVFHGPFSEGHLSLAVQLRLYAWAN